MSNTVITNEVRTIISDFYTDYMLTLDDCDLNAWPDFFAEDCMYRVTAKENWDTNSPLSTIRCESRGMIIDRSLGIQETMMYAPRYTRRFQSSLKLTPGENGLVNAQSSFLCIHTLVDEPSEVAFCGIAYDKISLTGDKPLFVERICVLDTEMVRNSLIYPL